MIEKQLQTRINILITILAFALMIFSAYFFYQKYQEIRQSSVKILSVKVSKEISQTIHALQAERGISVGFLARDDKLTGFAAHHIKVYQDKTDKQVNAFLTETHRLSRQKKNLEKLLKPFTFPRLEAFKTLYKKLPSLRQKILRHEADFDEVIQSYRDMIAMLLQIYYGQLSMTHNRTHYLLDPYLLEHIKENAGLERAYIFHEILSDGGMVKAREMIGRYIDRETNQEQILMETMTAESLAFYRRYVSQENEKELNRMREDFFAWRLYPSDAKRWFELASKRLDGFEALSRALSDQYLHDVLEKRLKKAKHSFYALAFLWLFAAAALMLLMWIVNRLRREMTQALKDLQVASYAFDAYEAMVITDPSGRILKVNKSFTRITGYSPEEAIGKKPNILKSGRHSQRFYREMWQSLEEKGLWRGEISNKRKNGEIYEEQLSITAIKDDAGKVRYYISQFLDISDLKKAEAEARYQADHDFLTGLPNRSTMLQKLNSEFTRAKRHHFLNAFLFIDLDDFKKVNDVYGHRIGDALLQQVARRLRHAIRAEDFAARISGDEFCVVLVDLGVDEKRAIESARMACSKLLRNLEKPYKIDDYELNIGVSFGVKLFPGKEKGMEEVINHADTAMYRAKEKGKNRFVFFDHEIECQIQELVELEDQMQAALKRKGELRFYYQPKVHVASGRISGAELLVRWHHPTRGILYPDTFLPILQNIAMMPRLSEMALEAACRFIVENKTLFDGTLAINTTVQELRTERFVQKTKEIIRSYGIDPSRIVIEILENDMIEDFDAVVSKMNHLRDFGLKFSIDDFGMGYSSVNYLDRLPINSIKIDRSFALRLQEPKTREMLKIVIRFAKIFGFRTILEGVDSSYQLDFARENQIEMYQGYYFSKAIEEEAFRELLMKEQATENRSE